MFFTPKPQFRGRKLIFQNLFSPLSNYKHPVQFPSSSPSFPPQLETSGCSRQLAMSSKLILKEKKLAFSFMKETPLKGTLSQQKNFSELVRVYYYQGFQRALGLRPAYAFRLTLHHLNQRVAFQCLRIQSSCGL